MSSRNVRKRKRALYILGSCITFGIGYYFLNEVSTWFEVPLGITFHVIFGCSLMAVSGICIGYNIQRLFFIKKKSHSKRNFLDKDLNQKSM